MTIYENLSNWINAKIELLIVKKRYFFIITKKMMIKKLENKSENNLKKI